MQRVSHFFQALLVFGAPGLIFGVFRMIIRRDHKSLASALSGIAMSLVASVLTGLYLTGAGFEGDFVFACAGFAALIADFLVEILFKLLTKISEEPYETFEKWYTLFRRK